MNEQKARIKTSGYFWLGSKKDNENNVQLNGPIHVLCNIIKLACSSAAEAELAAIFLNAQEVLKMVQALNNLGHKQKLIDITTDNSTADSIANETTK